MGTGNWSILQAGLGFTDDALDLAERVLLPLGFSLEEAEELAFIPFSGVFTEWLFDADASVFLENNFLNKRLPNLQNNIEHYSANG